MNAMARYYDTKCLQCEQDCAHFAHDRYEPGGEPYEACRFYGYILHPEKGISEEDCEGYITPVQKALKEERERKMRR